MNTGAFAKRIIAAATDAEPGAVGLLQGLFGGRPEEAAAAAAAHWGLVTATGRARDEDVRAVQAELLVLLSRR